MNTVHSILQAASVKKVVDKLKDGNYQLINFITNAGKITYVVLKKNFILLTGIALIFLIPLFVRLVLLYYGNSTDERNSGSQDGLLFVQKEVGREIKALDKKLASKIPKSFFLVINSSTNEFSLFKGTQLIKKDKCSTGSYILLKNGDQQKWMFKTPKGEFSIRSKTTSPVWKKPDWAFVEEGLPVPSANHSSRYEYGVLGDYALNLGQGYLIHGTLYQRYLGLPVTHGCIRLNDENLELVYKSLAVGSKVYIY
jgi:L,D-transpeptidase YbiS